VNARNVPAVTVKPTRRGHIAIYLGGTSLTINQAFDLAETLHEAALEAQRLARQNREGA
jgi:hypothetical protein